MANDVNIAIKTKGTKQAKKAFKEVGGASASLKKAALGLGAALGVRALGKQIGAAVNRAEEMNSAYAATEQIIKVTGGAANLTGQDIKGMAKEMSLATGVDKKLIIEGQNVILTFKNIRNEVGAGNDIFSRASGIMLDFSSLMGTDAKSAALQLGKALNDPIKGVSALARVGVAFTDQQKEQIRTMQESGDILGAQNVILGELEGQVGGVAEATADSTAKIANAFKEIQESVGNAILPIIDGLVPAFIAMGEAAPSAIQKIGLGFSGAKRAAGGFLDILDVVTGPIFNIGDAWSQQEEVLFQVNKRMGQYTESLAAGGNESTLFVSVLADLIGKGDATVGTLQALKDATGISGAEFKEAALFALENAEQLGITEEVADLLKRELRKLEQGTSAASTATGDFSGELGEVSAKGADALRSIKEVTLSMKELADPVFRAEQATRRFEEILEEVQKDLRVTDEEADELSQAYGEMQAATDAVTGDNIDAYEAQTTAALRRLDSNIEVSKGNLLSLPFAAEAGFDATARAFQRLVQTPLRVEVVATLPSDDAFGRAVNNAIAKAKRAGSITPTGF